MIYCSQEIEVEKSFNSELLTIGTGTYIVRMKLKEQIPQYLPIYGRMLRIYSPGIDRFCSNCYGKYAKQRCRNEKVQWI